MYEFMCRSHQKPWARRIKLRNRLVLSMRACSNFAFFTKLSMFFIIKVQVRTCKQNLSFSSKASRLSFPGRQRLPAAVHLCPWILTSLIGIPFLDGGAPRPEEGEVIALLHPNGIGTGMSAMDDKEFDHCNLQAVSTSVVGTTHNSTPPTEISGQRVLLSSFISKRARSSWPVSGAWGFPCPEHGNGVG